MMMDFEVVRALYIAATVLFILTLGGLSNQESSRAGNLYGMLGMSIAIIATLLGPYVTKNYILILILIFLVIRRHFHGNIFLFFLFSIYS